MLSVVEARKGIMSYDLVMSKLAWYLEENARGEYAFSANGKMEWTSWDGTLRSSFEYVIKANGKVMVRFIEGKDRAIFRLNNAADIKAAIRKHQEIFAARRETLSRAQVCEVLFA